ncbi:MAG TPA: HAMP domain-containing sensor histidine kinase [Capillimicrobium sp.]
MSFRRRISVLAGGAVAVAILLASVLAYVTIAAELRAQVDDSLRDRAAAIGDTLRVRFGGVGVAPAGIPSMPGAVRVPLGGPPPGAPGGTDFAEQIVRAGGEVAPLGRRGGDGPLPVDEHARAVADGDREEALGDVEADGERLRVLTRAVPGGGAVQVARSLAETDQALDRVRLILALVALAGIAVAALLGRFVAGRAIAPLARLTAAAEHVAATRDLDERIGMAGDDEVARLAQRFDEMLDALAGSMSALDASVRSQRQLIADASHELRTPVTSLRTNLEVLQANPGMDAQRRAGILARATAQAEELTALMADVIDLARGDETAQGMEPVRLDELVEEAIERARRHAPDQRFDADLAETTVVGAPARLARAVNNLLDNAVAWSEPGRPVDVTLRDGALTVRDRGPGFDPEEVDHVFDRFFRGAGARERSGSGLGLSIVRQVAESHGGGVSARNHPNGGAVVSLRVSREHHSL